MHSKRLNAWAEKKAHFRQAEVGQIDDSLGVRKGCRAIVVLRQKTQIVTGLVGQGTDQLVPFVFCD